MSEYNIQMNKYNALNAEYDQLYPATKIKNVNGLDTALQKKADLGADGKVPGGQVDAYSKADSISAETRTALSLAETATPDAALAEIARQMSECRGVQMDLLWKNASPTSTFPAQNLPINFDNYSHVGVIPIVHPQVFYLTPMVIVPVGMTGFLFLAWGSMFQRGFSVDSERIKFEICYQNPAYGTNGGAANNDILIPYFVYGIKGIK